MSDEGLHRKVRDGHRRPVGFQERMPTESLADITRERGTLSDDAQRHVDFPLPWFEIHGVAASGWRFKYPFSSSARTIA